jgi:hypothetical protein
VSRRILTKREVVAMSRRERTSERWQALGVGPQRKVRNADSYAGLTPASFKYCVIVRA